jgi:FixJ family two-component response regulator
MDKQARILVVDDMHNWRDLMRTMLEAEGFWVCTVDSLEGAISIFQRRYFHLAIVDVRLVPTDPEDIGGMRLLDELEKRDDPTPVIMLTGYGTVGLATQAFEEHGVFAFFEKYPGFDSLKFLSKVRKGIKQAQQSQLKRSTIGLRLEPILGELSLQELAGSLSPPPDSMVSVGELNQLLGRLLRPYLPLAPHSRCLVAEEEPMRSIELLSWSRAIGQAIAVRVGEPPGQEPGKPPVLVGDWVLEEQESSATSHLVGTSYTLPEVHFEDFMSAVRECE